MVCNNRRANLTQVCTLFKRAVNSVSGLGERMYQVMLDGCGFSAEELAEGRSLSVLVSSRKFHLSVTIVNKI